MIRQVLGITLLLVLGGPPVRAPHGRTTPWRSRSPNSPRACASFHLICSKGRAPGTRGEALTIAYLTSELEALGVQPAVGRSFAADEGRPGHDRVAIISDGLWKRRFAADPQILGSTIMLDGAPHTLVGVMPPRFWFRSDQRYIP